MKDDYLWDGSGEPDPDVEKLEGLLGRFRSERPAPELPETPVLPFRPRRQSFVAPLLAAAAAIVLSVGAGLWWTSRTRGPEKASVPPPVVPIESPKTDRGSQSSPPSKPAPPAGVTAPKPKPQPDRRTVRPTPEADVVAGAAPQAVKFTPLVDYATAGHIEQAELLLRSIRNVRADDADGLAEVAFDAKQSRDLLDQNAILRGAATRKKNLPVDHLLGDLEPFLLDIANLGDRPSRDDVVEIQQRLERHDVLSDLELYSANRPVPGF